MYGIINICAKALITEKYGEATWEKIRESAGVDDKFVNYNVYDDDVTYKIVHAASQLLDCSMDEVWELFGVYWVIWCMRNGYDILFRTLGGTLSEFLKSLDFLHSVYMKTMYPKMIVPSFRVEEKDESNFILHYYSNRRKLGGIVLGIVKGVSRIIFNSSISMHIIDHNEVTILDKVKDYYRFYIRVTDYRLPAIGTHGMITDEEWRSVISGRSSNHIRHTSIGSYHQGGTIIRDHSKLSCYDLVMPCQRNDQHTFHPNLPERMLLDGPTFCKAFPYHVVFNSDLIIMHAGIKLQELCPRASVDNTNLGDVIQLNHPEIDLTAQNIRLFIDMIFMVSLKQLNRKNHCLSMRGQMVEMKESGLFVFLSSPVLTSLTELHAKNMHFSDIAPHDVTRDLILFNQQRLVEVELAKELEQKKEELRTLMRDLAAEKKKTDSLLFSMLPKEVANDLREGRHVQAGEYPEVTVMFSDVVRFTDMCSQCQPIQVVHFLNEMYSMFDKLTTVNGVYKVETIGDAYMVAGGLPLPSSTHAARVVSFGLDTLEVIPKLQSPVSDHEVQIRIGTHTGPVVAGVVGQKMPRYCLFGDTVNTASRMESHGSPGKIHASHEVVKSISDDDRFHAEIRGDVFIKGKGKMDTYFIMRSSSKPTTSSTSSVSNQLSIMTSSSSREGNNNKTMEVQPIYQPASDRLELSVLSNSAHISNIKVSSNICLIL
nr:guanylate cyclase soluble subunit beta-2-like [Lytechinus pictus]